MTCVLYQSLNLFWQTEFEFILYVSQCFLSRETEGGRVPFRWRVSCWHQGAMPRKVPTWWSPRWGRCAGRSPRGSSSGKTAGKMNCRTATSSCLRSHSSLHLGATPQRPAAAQRQDIIHVCFQVNAEVSHRQGLYYKLEVISVQRFVSFSIHKITLTGLNGLLVFWNPEISKII